MSGLSDLSGLSDSDFDDLYRPASTFNTGPNRFNKSNQQFSQKCKSKKSLKVNGVSPLIGILILFTLTVVLASLTFVLIQPNLHNSNFVSCSGRIYDGGNSHSTQIVEIRSLAGDTVNMRGAMLDIKVQHAGSTLDEKVWGFPIPKNSPIKNWSGSDFVDRRAPKYQKVNGYCYLGKLSGDGIWRVGDIIGFRIKTTSIRLSRGDVVKVTVYKDGLPVTSAVVQKS